MRQTLSVRYGRTVRLLLALTLGVVAVFAGRAAQEPVRKILDPGSQTVDAGQIAQGVALVSDHLTIRGRLARDLGVRINSRMLRGGTMVENSGRIAYLLPLVPDGWSSAQPVSVVVRTPPSGFNVNANQAVEEAPAYTGIEAPLDAEARQIFTAQMGLRFSDRVIVLDMTPGREASPGDEIAYLFVAPIAAMLALWFLMTGLRGPKGTESQLVLHLHRANRAWARGLFGLGLMLLLWPLFVLAAKPELLGWIAIAVGSLLVAACVVGALMSLPGDPLDTKEIKTFAWRAGMSVPEFVHTLERELAGAALQAKGVQLLPSWLCIMGGGQPVTIVPYDDVVCVYKRLNNAGVAIVVEYVGYPERNGRRDPHLIGAEYASSAQEVDQLIDRVAARTPLAFHGWMAELETNRPEVLRQFEQRRAAAAGRGPRV